MNLRKTDTIGEQPLERAVCPKTPNIPVFLRQAGNTYHKYFNVIHKDDITKTIVLMRFINIIMILMRFKDDGSEE